MKKVLFIAGTFALCALFGAGKLWAGFAAGFLLLSSKNIGSSILWEIPMGVLISSIASDVLNGGTEILLRVLVPIAATLFAGFYPKKLFLFFPLAIAALLIGEVYGIPIMVASVWCGARSIFVKDDYSTKIYPLQGNNSNGEKLS